MIRSVENIGQGRVRVTFESGAQVVCMDDGSFTDWTGEAELAATDDK